MSEVKREVRSLDNERYSKNLGGSWTLPLFHPNDEEEGMGLKREEY